MIVSKQVTAIFASTLPLHILYFTSTLPLPNLYPLSAIRLCSRRNVALVKVIIISSQEEEQFPRWEYDIPTLGTKCSHAGNKAFPPWECAMSPAVNSNEPGCEWQ